MLALGAVPMGCSSSVPSTGENTRDREDETPAPDGEDGDGETPEDDEDTPTDEGDPVDVPDEPRAPCLDPLTVDVPAWGITNSGVYVNAGDAIDISASGTWNADGEARGPEGQGSDCGGGLFVRVGKFFERQCVGKGKTITAQHDGFLWFFQEGIGVDFTKQTGSLRVTIAGGDSCSGKRPEGVLSVFEDPTFDLARLEQFEPVCGKVPVLFDTDSPDDPVVKAYIEDFMGGDPEAYLRKAVIVACAVNYATPELAEHHGNGTMRLVHYLGAQKWEDLGRPKHVGPDGEEFWDFALSFTLDELTDLQHYGRFGAVADTMLHEGGHVLSPVGRVEGIPRWLNETYADFLSAKMGYFGPSTDNPENWVLYGRKAPYCDGYGSGVLFLDALDRKYPGFIHELSAYIVEVTPGSWPGAERVFEELTDRPLSVLYDEYVSEYGLELEKPVAECEFPE